MRVLFNWIAICATLGSFTSAKATDSYFASPIDTEAIVNGQKDTVVPASCNDSVVCNDGCTSNAAGLTCGNKPMRFGSSKATGCCGTWFDNAVVFSGAEAYKGIGDTNLPPGGGSGFMNSAGLVTGFNTSVRLGQSKIRGQIGGSFGVYDLKGRDTSTRTQSENQGFLTTGVFKRSDVTNGDRIAWGVVYDQLWANQWGLNASDLYLGQFRAITGLALNECNEIGVWGTARTNSDNYAPSAINPNVRLQAANQYNLYLRHSFAFGGSAMGYVGLVDHSDVGSWTTGTQFVAPMSCRVSVYGNSAFMFPSSATGAVGANELLWALSAGLSYSFGGKTVARNISGPSCMPLLPVANNGTFMVTTR
jgi:hypothetical protein